MRYAVIGFGETWQQTPFGDQSVRIIGLNELYKYTSRWDEWVEIHDEESLGLTTRVGPGQVKAEVDAHRRWLEQAHSGKTIWMQERFCDGRFPAAKPFPLHELEVKFGRLVASETWEYFTSSVALILAMLIARGRDEKFVAIDETAADEILLYGIDLIGAGEYEHQRPCAELFVGIALGLGIKVSIPKESALLKGGRVYGFEPSIAANGPITAARLAARIARLRKQHDGLAADIHKVKGAMTEAQNWLSVFEAAARGITKLPSGFLEEA